MSFFSTFSSTSSSSLSLASHKNNTANGNSSIKSAMKKSKNIIITGGARGIGRVMARHFLSSPAQQQQNRVFLIDVDAAELAYCVGTHLAAHVDAGGLPRVRGFAADMRDPAQIRAAVDDAAAWFPGRRVDVLVNNAGIGPFWSGGRTMEDPATAAEWASVVATNLSGPFLASQAVIPFMKKKVEGQEEEERGGQQRDGRNGGGGDGGYDQNGCGNSATITADGASTSSEDDKKKTHEEDTKVGKGDKEGAAEAKENAKPGVSAAINDTIDTIADAIKTTMNLGEKKDSDGSDDDRIATAIATAATTTTSTSTTTAANSSSSPSSPSSSCVSSDNNNTAADDDDDEAIFAPGPCIIHISSFRAHRSDPNSEAYAATKAGLVGLTHAMAVSAQAWGIRVNALSPGFISVRHECRAGDEQPRGQPETTWAGRHAAHEHALFPAGRVGRGEDIAEAVEFLVGAGYISEFF
ncbi:hypothetical protein SLS62_001668 [Diatrype stigma]|uniref:Uncharacterized protein n=1 Tax=Diatrype stigma TaxID=117547 RepID=A0AAN9V0R4_9PEZI